MKPFRSTAAGALALAALLAAGCAGNPARNEQLDSVLAQFDTDTDYAATERCLPTFRYDTVEVLDEQHLLFKSRQGDKYWLNKLRQRCAGLRPNDTLYFELRDNRVCSLDMVSVVDRTFFFWQRTGPSCGLGEFHELTEPQAQLIREAMRR